MKSTLIKAKTNCKITEAILKQHKYRCLRLCKDITV